MKSRKRKARTKETTLEIALRNKMRELRIAREMTTLEVAFRMGCSQATVSRIECGRQAIQLSYLVRFAQLLRLDISYFLTDSPDRIESDTEINPADEEKMISDLARFFNEIKDNASLLNTESPAYGLITKLHKHLNGQDTVNPPLNDTSDHWGYEERHSI